MTTLATILASAAEAGHKDEFADELFWIVGGVWAAFAVLISVVGMSRRDLGSAPARGIMGLGVLLAAGAMVSSVLSAG